MGAPPSPTRWERVKALVETALDQPAARRAGFLRTIAPPSLADEVTHLVTAYDAAEASGRLTSALADEPTTGDRIGPYRVLGRLGAGGMGAVYRAERVDGRLDRTVALKVVRHASADLALRFDRERRALALLEHPHIARLYDAGVDGSGPLGATPYLAMELVEGEPFTEAADRLGLGVEGRVRLVLQVCAAVGYAHGRLVLHRDLKPSNVLVAETASGLRAVVLDFGIAKLLGDEDDVLTQTGGRPYTPAYAAPEQLAGGAVTTATDVYGVGALLYELVAGTRPYYDLAETTAADTERQKALPPRLPSAVAPPGRARALRGDLDTICLKALAPEPERRYPTADALADDLRRHLDGLPVQARPATVRYRAGRFVRRHRTGVIAAALVALALIVGLSAALWQREVAQAERDHARIAAVEADEQAERAEAVAGFLEQILRAPNTRWYNDAAATGPDTPIRAVLDEAADRVDRDFADRPDLLADLHHILGDTYLALGLGDEAGRHHRRTLALRESLYTAPDPRIAEALYYAAGADGDHREAVRLMERAVAMQRARNEGNNFPFMANDLAGLYNELGRYAEADALEAEAIVFVEARFVPGADGERYRDRMRITLAQVRSVALLGLGRLDDADRQLVAADSVLARLPRLAVHYEAWRAQRCALGPLRLRQRRFAEAERDLLACCGERAPSASASPFPVRPLDERPLRDLAGPALVALYDATGRPEHAAPYRAAAARVLARADSLRAVFGETP